MFKKFEVPIYLTNTIEPGKSQQQELGLEFTGQMHEGNG